MKDIRLNKALAQAGVCSRRKADEYIAQGRVFVNGEKVVEMGLRINPLKDKILFDGKEIATEVKKNKVYLLLHKPIEVISSVKDPEDRKTVMDFIPDKFNKKRLYPVGRLDFYSEGLLLLTNDGRLTHRMTHPSFELSKEYEVQIREKPDLQDLDIMRKGMRLSDGEKLAPVKVSFQEKSGLNILHLTLYQGINRQIRRMCSDLNLTILKLTRTSIGPIRLTSLPYGETRELSPKEVKDLYASVGLK